MENWYGFHNLVHGIHKGFAPWYYQKLQSHKDQVHHQPQPAQPKTIFQNGPCFLKYGILISQRSADTIGKLELIQSTPGLHFGINRLLGIYSVYYLQRNQKCIYKYTKCLINLRTFVLDDCHYKSKHLNHYSVARILELLQGEHFYEFFSKISKDCMARWGLCTIQC